MTNRNVSLTRSTRRYGTRATDCRNQTYTLVSHYEKNYASGTNSPTVKGHLVFRQNAFQSIKRTFDVRKQLELSKSSPSCTLSTYATESLWPGMPADYMNFNSVTYLGSSSGSALQDRCASQFYAKLSELKLNAAEMFASRQKTIDLITSNANRIANLYLSLRRGRNPFTRQTCNGANASKLWLEHVYGWTPLVGDVYEALNLEKLDPPPFHFKVSKKENIRHSVDISGVIPSVTQAITEFSSFGTRMCTIRADITVNSPSTAFAKSLGLTNPALLAWELLPYSFVVDWFLPIGPWLESTQALSGLTVTNPSTTNGLVAFVDISCRASPSSTWQGKSDARAVNVNVSRVLTLPSLPLPKLKSPFSVGHAANALALLVSAFKK